MNANRSRLAAYGPALILSLLLAACGGGGGGSSATPTPSPTPTPSGPPALGPQCQSGSVARLALPTAAAAGRNQELALLACSGAQIDSVQWRQTGGTTLSLLSARSPALSVAPPQAGSTSFSVEFTDAAGTRHTGEADHHRQCGRRLAHAHPR